MNFVRIPVNYRHLESDARPFRSSRTASATSIAPSRRPAARHLLDHRPARAAGSQTTTGTPTTRRTRAVREHPHFQDRVVTSGRRSRSATRATPGSRARPDERACRRVARRVGPSSTPIHAVRAIDPDHIVFFDGNTYSTEFGLFGAWRTSSTRCTTTSRRARARRRVPRAERGGGEVPRALGVARRTGTPIFVGEFAPIYTGDDGDAERSRSSTTSSQIYRRYGAGSAPGCTRISAGRGCLVRPDSPTASFDAFVAKKNRLGADQWGSTGGEDARSPSRSRT